MKLLAGLGAVGLLLAIGYFTFTDSYYLECRECHSIQDVAEWRFGLQRGSSRQFLPAHYSVEESALRRDLFDESHTHVWEHGGFSGTKVFFGLVQRSISCGDIPHQFVRKCDDPGFRRFLLDKVASGGLNRQHLIRLLTIPDPAEIRRGADPLAERLTLLKEYSIGR
jgi:hypothetical protein